MIPITQVYENTGFVFGNYTDPLELYISGVTLNTNGKNQTKPTSSARMLERALQASAIDEANTDPPNSKVHQHALKAGDAKFDVNQEDGSLELGLEGLYGEDKLAEVINTNSFIIAGVFNPSDKIKSFTFSVTRIKNKMEKVLLWLIIAAGVLGFLGLLVALSMIYKKHKKKDELGFAEEVLIGEPVPNINRKTSNIIFYVMSIFL